MQSRATLLLAILASIWVTQATAVVERSVFLPLDVTQLYQYPKDSWFENLAVRANGQLLVSRLDTGYPSVIQFDPTNTTAPTTIFAWNATQYRGCLGISETVPDVFYVILSAFQNSSFVKISGMNSIFKIDMNTFAQTEGVVARNATVTKLVDITESDSLNGMATVDASTILVGDIYNGWVYKVDTGTGNYSVAINDPNMKAPVGGTTTLGVNGLKIANSSLYWSNSALGSMYKINITSDAEPCAFFNCWD